MIDPHVHLRDWEQRGTETLYHGLRTAARAGLTGVFDMPNTAPPIISREKLEIRLADAKEAQKKVALERGHTIFYGVYGGLTADAEQIREMAAAHRELFPAVVGLKMFTVHSTGNMGIIAQSQRKFVLSVLFEEGYTGVLAVHCEKQELLKPELWDPNEPHSHSAARPPEAETAAVQEIIEAAAETGFSGTLHICHISTPESLICIELARKKYPFLITCGITPHHALLDTSSKLSGNLLKVNPPLRDIISRKEMLMALINGRIDWIESDHAPHTPEEKRDGASGIPGIAGYLLLVRELLLAGVSRERVRELTGSRVCEVFGLNSSRVTSRVTSRVNFREDQCNVSDLPERAREASEEYATDPYSLLHFLDSDNSQS
ncbi:MAG: dihydroorotase [Spirochaetia bacterium]|nr:dihydroorotase [Spirochaetia bacterium]